MTNQDSSDEFPATAVMVEEALRNIVPFELWQAAPKGRREFPRRIVRYSEYLHGPQAIAVNRAAAQAKTAEAAMKQAWQQIVGELRSQLLAGKLTAYVRDVFPFGPVRPIPPDAWRTLRITNFRSGRATGPGVELTGIRIAPGPPQQCRLTRDLAEADLPQSTGNRPASRNHVYREQGLHLRLHWPCRIPLWGHAGCSCSGAPQGELHRSHGVAGKCSCIRPGPTAPTSAISSAATETQAGGISLNIVTTGSTAYP